MEAYAAIALRAWLTSSRAVSERTRRFARRPAVGALLLGMAGQVANHLLAETHVTRAPWPVTTLVASLPVLVLRLGTAPAHMLQADACGLHHRVEDHRTAPLGPVADHRDHASGPGEQKM
jgi:hypothetical protein